MNAVMGFLMTFLAGFVAALNIDLLIPTNPDYHASWVKVGVCVVVAVAGAVLIKSKAE